MTRHPRKATTRPPRTAAEWWAKLHDTARGGWCPGGGVSHSHTDQLNGPHLVNGRPAGPLQQLLSRRGYWWCDRTDPHDHAEQLAAGLLVDCHPGGALDEAHDWQQTAARTRAARQGYRLPHDQVWHNYGQGADRQRPYLRAALVGEGMRLASPAQSDPTSSPRGWAGQGSPADVVATVADRGRQLAEAYGRHLGDLVAALQHDLQTTLRRRRR